MRKILLPALLSVAINASAATETAKPDPSLVARYEKNNAELKAKLAECNSRKDIALVLADVQCISAQEAINRHQRKVLTSKCNSSDTFVFVPATLNGGDLEAYLIKHAPSEEALRRCNLTKDLWVAQEIRRRH